MNLDQIIQSLDLSVLTNAKDFSLVTPTAGYASDLLSCVMAGAKANAVWVTLQAHANIIAVASMLELSAIIITEGAVPEPATIDRANQEGIVLLSTAQPTYSVVGKLWELGLHDQPAEY
jgi:hypothetical protein